MAVEIGRRGTVMSGFRVHIWDDDMFPPTMPARTVHILTTAQYAESVVPPEERERQARLVAEAVADAPRGFYNLHPLVRTVAINNAYRLLYPEGGNE